MQRELSVLKEYKDHLIDKLENVQKSEKLADFIVQMKISGEYQNDPSKGNSATSSRENQ